MTVSVPRASAEAIAQCREQGLAEPEKVARESWPELFSEHSKPTPGVWELSEARGSDGEHLVVGGAGQSFGLIATVTLMGDARLIAEAGTVLHETGLTPRELQKQRGELLAALKHVVADRDATEIRFVGRPTQIKNSTVDAARAAIASVEGGAA